MRVVDRLLRRQRHRADGRGVSVHLGRHAIDRCRNRFGIEPYEAIADVAAALAEGRIATRMPRRATGRVRLARRKAFYAYTPGWTRVYVVKNLPSGPYVITALPAPDDGAIAACQAGWPQRGSLGAVAAAFHRASEESAS